MLTPFCNHKLTAPVSAGPRHVAVHWSMASKHCHCGAIAWQCRLLLVKKATAPPDTIGQQPSHIHGSSLTPSMRSKPGPGARNAVHLQALRVCTFCRYQIKMSQHLNVTWFATKMIHSNDGDVDMCKRDQKCVCPCASARPLSRLSNLKAHHQ